jgi:hypothetical protein
MSIPSVWRQVLDFFGTPLVIESSPGQLFAFQIYGIKPNGHGSGGYGVSAALGYNL